MGKPSGGRARRDLIVVGGSAGGIAALCDLARTLPEDLPAAVMVAHHFPASARSVLPSILNRSGPLPAAHASNGEKLTPGRIYVAPPGIHMVIREGRLQLVHGPQQNGRRPSIDVLFRSAAMEYGRRTIAILLSGMLDDGTAGLAAVKRQGGVAIVQDPNEAPYPDMPLNAIQNVAVDHVLPVAQMTERLLALLAEPISPADRPTPDDDLEYETAADRLEARAVHPAKPPGEPSTFTCPDCGGSLWETKDGEPLRFRCYVGHAYTAASLTAAESAREERALWTSLRVLEESTRLSRRLAERMDNRGDERAAERYRLRALDTLENAEIIRQLLLNRPAEAVSPPPPDVDAASLRVDKEGRVPGDLDPDQGTD